MTRIARPCLGLPGEPCGTPAFGGRCEVHARRTEQARHNRAYDVPGYRRARARAVREHVDRFGWMCPGYGLPPHPGRDLTADHPDPLARGGQLLQAFDVLCRGCNARKGARQAVPA